MAQVVECSLPVRKVDGSNPRSKTEKMTLVTPWLKLPTSGLEQDWLAWCQYNLTVWGMMFISGMVIQWSGTLKYDWSPRHYSISHNQCRKEL